MFGAKRTDVGGERGGKHVDAPVDEVDGSGSLACEAIQRGVDGEIVTDVGYVDAHFVETVDLAKRTGVVDVHAPDRIDAHHVVALTDVFPPFQVALHTIKKGKRRYRRWLVHSVRVLEDRKGNMEKRSGDGEGNRMDVRSQLFLILRRTKKRPPRRVTPRIPW